MSGEFTGIPFAAGDVRGVRSWSVDPLGRLISPSYRTVWTPGENVAECKINEGGMWVSWSRSFTLQLSVTGELEAKPKGEKKPAEHAQATCSCGFYAYSNGVNEYTGYGLTGVIAGYGETQLGTRGFKSAKARVLALHVPERKAKKARKNVVSSKWDHYDRLVANYPDVVIFHDYMSMLDAFPVYEHVPTPDSDPDFWTRSI